MRTGQYLRLHKITGDAILGLVQQLLPSGHVAAVEGDLVRFVPSTDDTVYLTMVDGLPDGSTGSRNSLATFPSLSIRSCVPPEGVPVIGCIANPWAALPAAQGACVYEVTCQPADIGKLGCRD